MATNVSSQELIAKILQLEGLSSEDKSSLIELLRRQKKFGIVWEDKPEAVEDRLREELPVLKEVKERAVICPDEGAPNHIIIEGDNLEALIALSYTHAGKVDVIYIDPPYNTGNGDFIYNDKFVDGEDKYRHSKWLSFMCRRLRIAKRLLSNKGVIFISIDDNEFAQLKLLCDEIFGNENFRNTLLIRRRTKTLNLQFAQNGLKTQNVGAEYVLVYAQKDFLFKEMRIKKKDVPSKGSWNVFWSNADRPTMRYSLLGFTPSSGQWRWSKEMADEAVDNYNEYLLHHSDVTLEEYWEGTGRKKRFIRRIDGGKGKNGGVQYWVGPSDTFLRTSNWTDMEVSQIHKNFDFNFNNPKNIEFIKEILSSPFCATHIILDFFAGSGTTLHATMQLNAEDGGSRQCILVTNNENHICEKVTYERNKRVIEGYTTLKGEYIAGLNKNSLRYYRTDFVGREPSAKNKRALVSAATDLLCIKNGIYKEVNCFGALDLRPAIARYFEQQNRRMLVIYNEESIPYFVGELNRLHVTEKVIIYVFAPGNYPFSDEFDSVMDKVQLCALPAAIYHAYLKVLPKSRRVSIPDVQSGVSEKQE